MTHRNSRQTETGELRTFLLKRRMSRVFHWATGRECVIIPRYLTGCSSNDGPRSVLSPDYGGDGFKSSGNERLSRGRGVFRCIVKASVLIRNTNTENTIRVSLYTGGGGKRRLRRRKFRLLVDGRYSIVIYTVLGAFEVRKAEENKKK